MIQNKCGLVQASIEKQNVLFPKWNVISTGNFNCCWALISERSRWKKAKLAARSWREKQSLWIKAVALNVPFSLWNFCSLPTAKCKFLFVSCSEALVTFKSLSGRSPSLSLQMSSWVIHSGGSIGLVFRMSFKKWKKAEQQLVERLTWLDFILLLLSFCPFPL